MIFDLSPEEVKLIIDSMEKIRLIDVRELWEFQTARIEGAELIPIGSFVEKAEDFIKEDRFIIYCHKGVRSYSACRYLVEKGFNNVINLKGGIDAWSRTVDSSVKIY